MPSEERAVKALALMLGAGAFWYGLYSPAQQLLPTAFLAAAGFWVRGGTPLSRTEAVALACLAAGAGMSLVQPAATGIAAHGPLVMAGWVLAMLLGRRLAATGGDSALRLLARMWAVVGPLMVFGGLAGMSYLPVHHSGRLASFLGYPIAVGVLGLLGAAGSLPPVQEGRWWAPALLFGNALAVFLSGSRGIWAVAVLLALYLAWAAPGLLRRAWWPVAGALVATLWAGPAVAAIAPVPALAAFLLGTLTVSLTAWFQARLMAVPVLLAGVFAPGWGWLLGRAHAFSLADGSSVERLTFLRDGLAVARSLPLGAGYRAWSALHLQHASYGYYSAEVHSAVLEIAISFGWLAAAGFLLLLIRFWRGLRDGRDWAPDRVAALAALGALAVHALLDWDLSYALFMIPLWFGIGVMGPGRGPPRPVRVPFGAVAGVAALALAGVAVTGTGDIFTGASLRSLDAGLAGSAYLHATMATTVTPWDDQAQVAGARALSALGDREGALAAFDRVRRLGPNEPWYAQLQAQELLRAGRLREAAAAYREMVRLWPWNVPGYEEALQAHMDLVLRADLLGDRMLSAELFQGGRTLLAAMDRQRAQEPPGMPRRAMQTDTSTLRTARRFFAR